MPKNLNSSKKRYVYIRDGYKCWRCGIKVVIHTEMKISKPSNAATVDHLIPKCLGGGHTVDNLQTCCFKCNCEMGIILNQLLQNASTLSNEEKLEIYQQILRGEF